LIIAAVETDAEIKAVIGGASLKKFAGFYDKSMSHNHFNKR
jgi:hypothetical protein